MKFFRRENRRSNRSNQGSASISGSSKGECTAARAAQSGVTFNKSREYIFTFTVLMICNDSSTDHSNTDQIIFLKNLKILYIPMMKTR